jgi:ribosome biogenesis GTPase / thiamine phosphate phosphatase
MQQNLPGRVIATFGRHMLVRAPDGQQLKARPFGRALTVVCGDEIEYRVDPRNEEVHVVAVQPRRTALYRTSARGQAEPVVANLTQLFVVLAPLPLPDLFVVDRYLAAAYAAGVGATLIVNKADLGIGAPLAEELRAYGAAGYQVLQCSAESEEGVAPLRAALGAGVVAALVGQSGVGKSSLVQRLVPHSQIEIGPLVREEEGRHTTTASRLYELPTGAALIDSPGVRDFAPAIEALGARELGFIEIERLAGGCRFADCRHMREPNCAVRAAAESGALAARRYESYRRLRRLREEISAAQAPRGRR